VSAPFSVYEVASGRIVRQLFVRASDLSSNVDPVTEATVPGTFAAKEFYVNEGVVTLRSDNPSTLSADTVVADGVSVLILSNVPVGSTVTVSGPVQASSVVDDGSLEITVDIAGGYTVFVDSFPTRTKELSFVAT